MTQMKGNLARTATATVKANAVGATKPKKLAKAKGKTPKL